MFRVTHSIIFRPCFCARQFMVVRITRGNKQEATLQCAHLKQQTGAVVHVHPMASVLVLRRIWLLSLLSSRY